MDKEARYSLYKGAVCPGWWPILDEYIPQILAVAPDAEFHLKEKFGLLRMGALSKSTKRLVLFDIQRSAEEASSAVCEYCGAPGQLRTDREWMQTLCDRCNAANEESTRQIIEEAEKKWIEDLTEYAK